MNTNWQDIGADDEKRFHTYTTHKIPWYVRVMWVCFWVALVWYIVTYAIPAAKTYF